MKIKHSQVKPGDLLLMAKNANLTAIKVISITKAGSIKYSFKQKEDWKDEDSLMELDHEKHNKILYYKKWTSYDDNFWLLHREEN